MLSRAATRAVARARVRTCGRHLRCVSTHAHGLAGRAGGPQAGTSSSSSGGGTGAPLQSTAEVAIIGGGVIGSSMLYHLAKAGVTDAVLLEKTELTAGSTWHAAGLTTYFNPGANARNFHYDSLALYKRLEQETGLDTSFHEVGSIRLIESQERLDEALHQMGMSALWPAEQRLITPEEAAALHPLLDVSGLLACIYNPGDGHIDPTSVTNVLIAAAKAAGAKVHRYTPVEGLTQLEDGRWQVHTHKGTVTANKIINCGGLWAREVGRMAGVELPLVHIEHQYVITGPVPEVESLRAEHGMRELPVIRDLYGSYYLRQERNGLLIGPYEPESLMKLRDGWHASGMPGDFGMELFEGDLERIMPHLEIALERVPAAVNGGIKDVINGPVAWSPDGQPMLGPQLGKKNLWNACAFSYGIVHAGGAGKYMIDWMLNGEPPYELTEFDTARYGEWATPEYTAAKVRESYGWNNVVVYPDLERTAGRPCRVTGVHDALAAKGAHFGFHNGWEVPKWFDSSVDAPCDAAPSFRRTGWFEPVKAEVTNVVTNAGVIDLTAFSKFQVEGPGATAFLESLCGSRMPAAGRVGIVHMMSPKGAMIAELTVANTGPDSYYVVTGSEMERHDLRWFEHYMPTDGSVSVTNRTTDTAVLGVCGPKSRVILQRVTDTDLGNDAFKFLDCRAVTVGTTPLLAMRLSYTGELGWELHVPAHAQRSVYDAVVAAGADDGLRDFGSYAMNSLRLEVGFKLLGTDMTKDHTAVEAGLVPRFVRLKAHDYVGRDALREQKASGALRQKAVYLVVDADGADCWGNEPLYEAGTDRLIGFTTSGGYGHSTQLSLANGYMYGDSLDFCADGTAVEVEILGQRRPATVRQTPVKATEPMRKAA